MIADKVVINNPKLDRRVKLTDEDRENIVKEYKMGIISQRGLAAKYGVSRRTIQFVLDPEQARIVKEQYKERRKDGRYYNKEKHRESMRKHREYKKSLIEKNLITV